MTQVIVISGLILLLGIIFFVLMRQGNQQLASINIAVHNEAKIKGLQIKSIITPGFKEWRNSPFDRGKTEISNKKVFFRVVNYQDAQSSSEKTIWVRATKSQETGGLTLEWKDVVSTPQQRV